ncbi:exported hypothetical protein [Frankia canadensis]|uniref:Secreted protein n=1 Tax=Frankia canadensis TaxID=1836972 RepID=A0A2I2KWZ7_9ACTN|nr:exported hypothetical protein [Frankia canadensis]SOU57462.1 exported hypothetical protein [Frankia canadensis]
MTAVTVATAVSAATAANAAADADAICNRQGSAMFHPGCAIRNQDVTSGRDLLKWWASRERSPEPSLAVGTPPRPHAGIDAHPAVTAPARRGRPSGRMTGPA